ncbi:MAG TPA: crotonase/enoyl-CoA hydratase family protein [Ilumatobacter sp.]|nr:crotonase/enoyl-CoA hydratase family protein [Ilumatobacter sp.]
MSVTTERRGAVLVIHLDDGRANAVTHELLDGITSAVREAEADPEIKALVVHGRPGRFSGGFDLAVMRGDDVGAIAELAAGGAMLVHTLYSAKLPVVIACTGHAIAMGAMLVLSGDVRVGAAGEFKIGMSELAIGMALPAWALTILVERLDRKRLQEALMTARLYDPTEAVAVGYLDEVVAPEQVLDRAIEVADGLATTIDPRAYAVTLRLLRGAMLDQLEAEATAFRDGGVL